jgi:hypothetical protein
MKSFKAFFYENLNNEIDPNTPYIVIDKKTKEIVWRGTYSKRDIARRVVDRRDNAYGGYRFIARIAKPEEILKEYAHNNADGTPKQTLKAHNGKGGGANIGLDAKYQHTVGPYQKKVEKLNVVNSILTFPELEDAGIKDIMNIKLPIIFKNVKNSKADVQIFKNQKGMIVGKVIKPSPGLGK